MVLHSLQFLMYFVVLMIILLLMQYCCNSEKTKKQFMLLVIGIFSLFFIYKFDWRFCACLVGASMYSCLAGLLLANSTSAKRKFICSLSVTGLVVFLGFFKYANFFLENVNALLGREMVYLKIILPVGISFYVFSAISYIFDVYRCRIDAEKNFFRFAFYMLFFPKVIAGPIVRAKDFLPQVVNYSGISFTGFNEGIQLFAIGLFKKLVLADHLKVFVDDVFHAPVAYDTPTVVLCIFSYALQIYFDFSGYSDMAIGISKILGFSIADNFNFPYIATNMSDFWKRWHISLSAWLRDYIYIPLGGSKKGELITYGNIMAVMLISGLWHGAGWTFVLWGGMHGLCSCVNVFWKKHIKAKFSISNSVIFNFISKLITFVIVALLWVFFRADSFANAKQILLGAVTLHGGIRQIYTWSFFAAICLLICSVLYLKVSTNETAVDKQGVSAGNTGRGYIMDLRNMKSQIAFFTLIGITIIMGYYGNNAFIYGRF